MELRPEYLGTLWGIKKQFACLKPLLESVFVHRAHQQQSNKFSAMEDWRSVSQTSQRKDVRPAVCYAIWCLASATQTINDICVTFVVIASRIANAQRDAANICNCEVLVFTGISLSNVKNTNACVVGNVFSMFQHFLVLLWQSSNPSCSVATNGIKEKSGKWLLMRQTSILFIIE